MKFQCKCGMEWDVPEGRWIIVRTGHRMTGSRLMIAPPEADGLSVDWFSSEGVDLQFENLGKVLLAEAGPFVGKTVKYFCDDSFEDGFLESQLEGEKIELLNRITQDPAGVSIIHYNKDTDQIQIDKINLTSHL